MDASGQLWETTFVDPERDLALAITSIPSASLQLPDAVHQDQLGALLGALRLFPVAEIPQAYLTTAITALLATTDIEETQDWLTSGPDPVPLGTAYQMLEAAQTAYALPPLPQKPRRKRRFPPPISKEDAGATGVTEFAREAASEPLVPFQRSPVQVYSLPELLHAAGAVRVVLVTARSNPLLIVEVVGGYLLYQTVIGAGQGIRRGMADGVRYRLLKLLRAPTGDEGHEDDDGHDEHDGHEERD